MTHYVHVTSRVRVLRIARCQPAFRARWIAWTRRRFGAANKRRSQMATKKPRVAEKRAAKKKQTWITIVDEVDTFEELAPRLHELLLTSPDNARVYVRVRDPRTLN